MQTRNASKIKVGYYATYYEQDKNKSKSMAIYKPVRVNQIIWKWHGKKKKRQRNKETAIKTDNT